MEQDLLTSGTKICGTSMHKNKNSLILKKIYMLLNLKQRIETKEQQHGRVG
jgi:hypothetical protein